jgi:hypothetical protein
MESECSFCSRKKGEGWSERVIREFESGGIPALSADHARDVVERLRSEPDRKIRLLLPGPGDLKICDVCVDLYADAVRRELALPT